MEEILLTSWYVKYPIIYKVLAPSQVVVWDFFHQQYYAIIWVFPKKYPQNGW